MSEHDATATRPVGRRGGLGRPRIARGVLGAALAAIAAIAIAPGVAGAAPPPKLTIASPAPDSVTNNATPTFAGITSAEEEEFLGVAIQDRLTVVIKSEAGEVVQEPSIESPIRPQAWSIGPVAPLPPGTYTARVIEREVSLGSETVIEQSPQVRFTVDTVPPAVTLTSPANGSTTTLSSQAFAGAAGTAPGDGATVTVQLFAGPSIGSQPPIEGLSVPVADGHWSATLGGLTPGTYTARAEQSDEAGNLGTSAPVTFTVTVPVIPPVTTPPIASFKWFPQTPVVGEPVTLVSSSTDQSSALAGFAWGLTPTAALIPGKQVTSTTFATAGDHPVRLRITAADGQSAITTETIHVVNPRLSLMAPFPVVRIAGTVTFAGVNISLLTVQAPVGARVRVSCRGRGCRTASESRLAASSSKKHRASMVVIAFRRFQGPLRAGAVLEIRIFKNGVIGKYTEFVIRRGRLPVRIDKCVGQAGLNPIACPIS
ncbi:MAG TPA: hypothetical protein VGN08_06145 [Solirubrobacteraceae bacterium]